MAFFGANPRYTYIIYIELCMKKKIELGSAASAMNAFTATSYVETVLQPVIRSFTKCPDSSRHFKDNQLFLLTCFVPCNGRRLKRE